MYFDIVKLASGYNAAKAATEAAHSMLVQAENIFKAVKAEFDYKLLKGKINKNAGKAFYSKQMATYSNAQTIFNLASSFQQFKGQQFIDANLKQMMA